MTLKIKLQATAVFTTYTELCLLSPGASCLGKAYLCVRC